MRCILESRRGDGPKQSRQLFVARFHRLATSEPRFPHERNCDLSAQVRERGEKLEQFGFLEIRLREFQPARGFPASGCPRFECPCAPVFLQPMDETLPATHRVRQLFQPFGLHQRTDQRFDFV